LEIAIWSAIQIQAAFRGWFARDSLEDNHYCAMQIQRIVRGYLATMHVFEDLYSITIVQSVVRMHLAINDAVDRLSSIIAIQTWYRGVKCRYAMREIECSAIAIQANWRRYLAQTAYQFDIIDVIIVQSIARRRKAIILRKNICATKIQAAWRSYDCSISYVHTLADIITVQSVVRRWQVIRHLAATRIQCLVRMILAQKKFAKEMALHVLVTRHMSATKIQACWRSYSAQVHMLVTIVNIIVIQSLWRRRRVLVKYKAYLHRIKLARERKTIKAAVKIQSVWRGFITYSTYLIKRYETQAAVTIQAYWRRYWQSTNYSLIYFEVIKIQAFVRGYQERNWQSFRRECCTIIQSASRGYLARKECHNDCMISILISAAATSLRMRNAAARIQRWWSEELFGRKQKHAALVIERFFIYVKKEVEKEVKALKKKKKERRMRRKMRQSDDWILERAWLNTIEDTSAVADEKYQEPYYPPPANSYGQNAHNMGRVINSVDDDVQSEVSGLTDLSFGNRYLRGSNARNIRRSKREIEEEHSLEEAFLDSEIQQAKEKRLEEEEYLRRHGISKHQSRRKTKRPSDQRAQLTTYPGRRYG
jgi:hypothetical protein